MPVNVHTGAIELFRRDVPMADASVLNPSAALPLLQGEWLKDTTTGWSRITAGSSSDTKATDGQMFRPVFSQRGDAAVQALGKVTVLDTGPSFRMETDIYKTVGLSVNTYPRFTQLTVAALDTDAGDAHAGRTVLVVAATGDPVFALVETPPAVIGDPMVVTVLPSAYIMP